MKSILRRYVGNFQYGQKEVLFHFWLHTDGKTPIDTVLFLGSGQRGRITKWVAANTPKGTVVVEGLPHKMADRTARDLKEFASSYTSTAFLVVLNALNIASAHVVAESQAAPGAVWMALKNFARVRNVILIAPLGFTAHTLGASPEERLKELKKRALLSSAQFAQSPLYDWRNLYLNSLMLHVLLFDARWRISGRKYAIGASHDLREDCRELAFRVHQKGGVFALLLGQRDRMFPPAEITAAIAEAKIKHITTITLKTSHTSLAIRDGKEILHKAIITARQ